MPKIHLNRWQVALVALIIWHVSWNLFWIVRNQAPLPWDSANHARLGLEIIREIRQLQPWNVLRVSDYYPPFVHSTAALAFLIFPFVSTTASLISTSWFVIALISLYSFVKVYFKDEPLAFWTTALFSFFPIIYSESRLLLLDIPTAALMLIVLTLLKKSQVFHHRRYTILAFLAMSALALTKWAGIPFIIAPFTIYFLQVIWRWQSEALTNFGMGLALALVITAPWYIINLPALMFNLTLYTTGESVDPVKLGSIENLTYYTVELANRQITPIMAVVFGLSLAFVALVTVTTNKTREDKATIWLILGLLVFYYLIFTFVSNKDPRYTLPGISLVAVVIALASRFIMGRVNLLAKGVATLIGLYLVVYFLILNIRPGSLEGFELPVKLPLLEWIRIIDINDRLVLKPKDQDWQAQQLLNDLDQLTEGATVHMAVDFEYFNPLTMNYLNRRNQYQGKTTSEIQFRLPDIYSLIINFQRPYFETENEILRYLAPGDFVVLTEGEFGPQYIRHFQSVDQLRYYLIGDRFKKCADFTVEIVPAGNWCYVREGEVVQTDSDVITYAGMQMGASKDIQGFTRVSCPWACSFRVSGRNVGVGQSEQIKKPFTLQPIHSYQLPNSEIATLYRITWDADFDRSQQLIQQIVPSAASL